MSPPTLWKVMKLCCPLVSGIAHKLSAARLADCGSNPSLQPGYGDLTLRTVAADLAARRAPPNKRFTGFGASSAASSALCSPRTDIVSHIALLACS
jgi:hypothetical protein